MIRSVSIAALLALAACDGTHSAQVAQAVTVACQIDAVAQPIALAITPVIASAAAPAATPAVAAGVALDQSVVHPAVQAACDKLGGTLIPAPRPAP